MEKTKQLSLLYILVASLAVMAMATIEDDEKKCADELTNLAACIPYVSGTATKPTPACCENTKKVRSANPKCLCVLIKESTDPSLGLPINTTLALKMPTVCNIDAKVSDCPYILNLPADSPDAKIFRVATDSSTSSTTKSPPASASTSSESSTSSSSSSSPSASSSDTKTTSSTNNGAKLGQNLLVMIGSAAIVSFFFFF